MADLIVIVGPPASGKAAVGHSLATAYGFRFFHNHMTADAVAALFGWGTDAYGEVAAEIRLHLLGRALDDRNSSNVVFTFVWGFNLDADNKFISDLVAICDARGAKVHFVELVASLAARISREGTPLRIELKPAKRDVERARAHHARIDARLRMNSSGDFPYPDRHLVIDTEAMSPAQAAHKIAAHFSLATHAAS